MGTIRLLFAPIRALTRFPVFQFAIVVVLILYLQAADDSSVSGHLFDGLDRLVDSTVTLISAVITVKSFTKSWLTSGFMIVYVYLACWFILLLLRVATRAAVDLIGRSNLFWLRNAIARERGIEAYRAWLPLEKIRPDHVAAQDWEREFAWPANNQPPYPSLTRRIIRAILFYGLLVLLAAVLLQAFTRFQVLTWISGIPAR